MADAALSGPLALELRDVTKTYPGVRALDAVNFQVAAGSVHALLGENGAGKSTLLKILAGVEHADSGEIWLNGTHRRIDSPKAAQTAGITLIHQELQLVPEFDVAQNLFLGRTLNRFGIIKDSRAMRVRGAAILGRLGATFDVRARIRDLSIAQKQLVEIGRAMLWDARVIAMDEPTSSLTPQEFEALARLIADIASQGVAIIYVSHKLDEVARLCATGTVLRDGAVICDVRPAELPSSRLVTLMVGREISHEAPTRRPIGEPLLRAEGLNWRKRVRDVNFVAYRGEILCIGGLVGAGRSELVRLLAGAARPDSGQIVWKGRPIRFASPRQALRAGIGLAPEDRKREAIVPIRPILTNVALPVLGKLSRVGIIRRRRMRNMVSALVQQVHLRPPVLDRQIRLFSGGNQQKAIICRLLGAEVDLLIFDEPTRGIDVAAKQEIYRLIEALAAADKAIIVVSSELPEILRLADRVLVMCEGRISAELPHDTLSEEVILRHAIPTGHTS